METPVTRLIGFCASNKLLILSLVAAGFLWGAWVMMHLPLDATPDLSETQVIVLSRWDRSPDIIEDQVTYPIIVAMTVHSSDCTVPTTHGSHSLEVDFQAQACEE